MVEVVIADAVRSPMRRGRHDPAASPVELLGQTISALFDRTGIDPSEVDEVVVGSAYSAGAHGQTLGRTAWLSAGLPQHVPLTAINGSGHQVLHVAARHVRARGCGVAVVAGVDSALLVDEYHTAAASPDNASSFPLPTAAAELVADKWGLDRQQLDAYAERSRQRAAEVLRAGEFSVEIAPITLPGKGSPRSTVISCDDTIDEEGNCRAVWSLPPLLLDRPDGGGRSAGGPVLTASNSAPPVDGAAALLLMTSTAAQRLLWQPRALLRSSVVVADDPAAMLAAPKRATERVLANAKLGLNEIDHFEVDETFASVPLAWLAEFPVPIDMFNPRGGALALGATPSCGAMRVLTTMLNALEATGGRYGLQTLCGDAGTASAALIERL